MAESDLREEGGKWLGSGPGGPVRIRFTPHNEYGVMDHVVGTGMGDVHVPCGLSPICDGAEVMLNLFRQPEIDDTKFSADAKWIAKDLQALRDLAEREL